MIVLNFSHPLTEEQKAQIESLTGNTTSEVRTIPVQIEQGEPLGPQIVALADAAALSSEEWQKTSLVINPPGLSHAACLLLAELHGRMGRFPSIIRITPRHSTITTYGVSEIINLQNIREEARQKR